MAKQYIQRTELPQTADSGKAPQRVQKPIYTFYGNAGHGANDPALFGKVPAPQAYTTWRQFRGKFYQHVDSKGQLFDLPEKYQNATGFAAGANSEIKPHIQKAVFHGEGYFYEGVENRIYLNEIIKALKPHVDSGLLRVVVVSHEWQDTDRVGRINAANADFAQQRRINPKARGFWLGQHFNAANGKANGICGFTSVGQTHSDKVVERILRNLNAAGYGFFDRREARAGIQQIGKIRTENGDGDLDHEKNFDEVALTKMPAGLMEPNFFDNFADALLIHYDKDFKAAYVAAVVAAVVADAKGEIR
jgi:hypothetical protein